MRRYYDTKQCGTTAINLAKMITEWGHIETEHYKWPHFSGPIMCKKSQTSSAKSKYSKLQAARSTSWHQSLLLQLNLVIHRKLTKEERKRTDCSFFLSASSHFSDSKSFQSYPTPCLYAALSAPEPPLVSLISGPFLSHFFSSSHPWVSCSQLKRPKYLLRRGRGTST